MRDMGDHLVRVVRTLWQWTSPVDRLTECWASISIFRFKQKMSFSFSLVLRLLWKKAVGLWYTLSKGCCKRHVEFVFLCSPQCFILSTYLVCTNGSCMQVASWECWGSIPSTCYQEGCLQRYSCLSGTDVREENSGVPSQIVSHTKVVWFGRCKEIVSCTLRCTRILINKWTKRCVRAMIRVQPSTPMDTPKNRLWLLAVRVSKAFGLVDLFCGGWEYCRK